MLLLMKTTMLIINLLVILLEHDLQGLGDGTAFWGPGYLLLAVHVKDDYGFTRAANDIVVSVLTSFSRLVVFLTEQQQRFTL